MKNKLSAKQNPVLIILLMFYSLLANAQSITATVSVAYDDPNHCAGYGVFLNASPDDNSLYNYSWSCPSGICPPNWNPSDASSSFFPTNDSLGNGIYTVTITEISTGSASSASIMIDNYPTPTVGISGNNSGCEGTTSTIFAKDNTHGLNQYGPYLYSWGGAAFSSSDSLIYTFGPNFLGFIESLTIRNSFGCVASNSSILWMYGSPTPITTISANGPVEFCSGENVELLCDVSHPTHSFQNISYQWKKYGTYLSDMDSSFNANTTGRYRCIASSNGCASTSNFIDITANPLPIVSMNPSGQTGYCFGQSVVLTASSPTAISYQWKKYGNIINGQVNNSLSVSSAGKYKVIVQDANGCIRTSPPVEVVGPPNNQVSASGPLTFCQGGSVTFTAAPGFSYQWKKRANGTYVDIPLATNQSFTATASGKYKVFVTNPFTNCTVSSSAKSVIVNCKLSVDSGTSSEVEIYPNPFNSQLTISLPDEWNENITILLYDLAGRLVYQMESVTLQDNQLNLPFAELKNGTYMLKVISNGEYYDKVILKQ